jgi:predicted Zn-dependent protease
MSGRFMNWRRVVRWMAAAVAAGMLSACATNPVTGERELSLVSEDTELAIGRKQYQPSRQMQGGDYILDRELIGYVQGVGQRLAAVSDRKLPYEFTVINNSTPNAWALPGGKIAINRGLLVELESEAELAAVLAHEIVHAAARHGAKGVERGVLLQGALIATGMAAGGSDYSDLVVGAASVGANLINQGYSRDAELEADRYGMLYMSRAGYDPRAAVRLQETFVRLSKDKRPNWLSGLFASHPPSAERVEKNREMAEQLAAAGGDLGVERYRRMVSRLLKSKPAYDDYEKGRKLLADKHFLEAGELADQASRLEPEEALFHTLKGDTYAQRRKFDEAMDAYDRALRLNDSFFGHYLRRGELRERLGDLAGAESDLKRSLELLPTADAHLAMGRLAARQNDRQQAVDHFKAASSSRGQTGRSAAIELVRIDLPENPHLYVSSRVLEDSKGRLLVRLKNTTPVPLQGIRLLVGQAGIGGRMQRVTRHDLHEGLAPGEERTLYTGIRLSEKSRLEQWGVRVIAASTAVQ